MSGIAREVKEDVRETVRSLREELTRATREVHRESKRPAHEQARQARDEARERARQVREELRQCPRRGTRVRRAGAGRASGRPEQEEQADSEWAGPHVRAGPTGQTGRADGTIPTRVAAVTSSAGQGLQQ